MNQIYDVAVIGAGPGGLAAVKGALDEGAQSVILFEREDRIGGILNQCIHDGFGLIRYKASMTGPEYARKAAREIEDGRVMVKTGTMVLKLEKKDDLDVIQCISSAEGLKEYPARSVVLATGCRERTRGAISTPGTRPAGVFSAGVAQNFVNVRNMMPGKRIVILGSGDIGLIMARRLTLEGAEVVAVLEIMKEPCGLERNVSQCLYDWNIPLFTSTTVTRIFGQKRITAVEASSVDDKLQPIEGTQRILECDTLILSVGLIPENEVAKTLGIQLDPKTNGTITDEFLETSCKGIFSCGNSRKVMDLADFVSQQGEIAGHNAARAARGQDPDRKSNDRESKLGKGFPHPGCITCILCPNGCRIKVEEDGTTTGNNCPKGREYAIQEQKEPRRNLTLTVRTTSGRLLPVRTSEPVPKTSLTGLAARLESLVVEDRGQSYGYVDHEGNYIDT